jgi:chromosome segregation ATPase
MKNIILSIILLSTFWATAQNKSNDFEKEIKPLNDKLVTLQKENNTLLKNLNALSNQMSSLSTEIKTNKISLDSLRTQTEENSKELDIKISSTEKNTNQKITAVDESLGKNSLYGIIGVLSAILLSGLLYWLLSKRQKIDKTDFIDQLSRTKSNIEESLIKEFGKQTELMDTQLHLLEQQKTISPTTPNAEPDHSLPLKLASEINLIERNIKLMDVKTKGLKQLQASVGKLKDNLSANGYEMPELLGKQFHQGMKLIVTSSIPDETLEKDSEIISKVLIPQVNYNDKMIQTAQIEVSVGY